MAKIRPEELSLLKPRKAGPPSAWMARSRSSWALGSMVVPAAGAFCPAGAGLWLKADRGIIRKAETDSQQARHKPGGRTFASRSTTEDIPSVHVHNLSRHIGCHFRSQKEYR